MGLFSFLGGGKPQEIPQVPQTNLPQFPDLLQAGEARGRGVAFGEEQTPLALGAREQALGILQDPARATEFFGGFQPTSFEQGITGTFFQDALEQAKRVAGQRASLAGNESAFAPQFARAIGPTIFDIGNLLAGQGQRRGELSLEAQLGIDPIRDIIDPIGVRELEQDFNQQTGRFDRDVEQAILDQQRELANRNIAFQNEERRRETKSKGISGFGSLAAMAAAVAAAPFTGGTSLALLPAAASIGGTVGGIFGGSESPVSLGDAASISQIFSPQTSGFETGGNIFSTLRGFGQGTPPGTFNTGSFSQTPRQQGQATRNVFSQLPQITTGGFAG